MDKKERLPLRDVTTYVDTPKINFKRKNFEKEYFKKDSNLAFLYKSGQYQEVLNYKKDKRNTLGYQLNYFQFLLDDLILKIGDSIDKFIMFFRL